MGFRERGRIYEEVIFDKGVKFELIYDFCMIVVGGEIWRLGFGVWDNGGVCS